MAPHLQRLVFQLLCNRLSDQGYALDDHDDPGTEVSRRVSRDGQHTHVSLFANGTIRVNPSHGACERERDSLIAELGQLQRSLQEMLPGAYEFLEEGDRELALVTRYLIGKSLELVEYSALVMPLAKAFEGFAKKLLVRLQCGNAAQIDEPDFFRGAFGGAAYQALLRAPDDRRVLERLRTHLPFCRHGLMHNPARPGFVLRDHTTALAKEGEILTVVRETYENFRNRL